MPEKKSVFLAASVDVEEEGLFSGRYAACNLSLKNIKHLPKISHLIEKGLKPTLFCAHGVFADRECRKTLEFMRDKLGAEIGAHLHHWNTPPFESALDGSQVKTSVPASEVKIPLLEQKLASLLRIAGGFQGSPVTSFRMGRWDLHNLHWPILARYGVKCDASVRPLHACKKPEYGPDHYGAPLNPYFIETPHGKILEIPLTVTPLFPGTASIPQKLRPSLKKWGVLPLLSVQYPLWLLKYVSARYLKAGGKVISLTWHSSEMMPGGAPHMPDDKSTKNFMSKLDRYLGWLMDAYNVTCLTMNKLVEQFKDAPLAIPSGADWCFTPE